MLRETSESVIVFKMHLTGQLAKQLPSKEARGLSEGSAILDLLGLIIWSGQLS